MTLIWAVKEERPPLPDGRDGLARSFMHIANQYPVNWRRSAKRLAFGAWGLVPKWWVVELLRAPVSVQMECRSTWRSRDCLPKDGTRRWVKNCWSRGQVVRLLLWSAEVECRPSWLLRFRYTNCGAGERKAHQCNDALLSEANPTTLGMAWLRLNSFRTEKASRPRPLLEGEQPRCAAKRLRWRSQPSSGFDAWMSQRLVINDPFTQARSNRTKAHKSQVHYVHS